MGSSSIPNTSKTFIEYSRYIQSFISKERAAHTAVTNEIKLENSGGKAIPFEMKDQLLQEKGQMKIYTRTEAVEKLSMFCSIYHHCLSFLIRGCLSF